MGITQSSQRPQSGGRLDRINKINRIKIKRVALGVRLSQDFFV